MILRRLLVPALVAVLLLTTGACSSGGTDNKKEHKMTSGILAAKDMPFEVTDVSRIDRPPILTQLGSAACLGIEQGVLYDAGWTVQAHEFSGELHDWVVVAAVFSPPPGETTSGLEAVQTQSERCMAQSKDVKTKPLDLGADRYGFEIDTQAGSFDSARGYATLSKGRLAQISIMEMKDQDAGTVLKGLLDKLP